MEKFYYKVGDRVRIVSRWCGDGRENNEGEMDQYLGTVMTIREFHHNWRGDAVYSMEEDQDDPCHLSGWFWFHSMIEGLAAPKTISTSMGGVMLLAADQKPEIQPDPSTIILEWK